LKLIYSINT